MFNTAFLLGICLLGAVAAGLALYAVWQIFQEAPKPDREYMDPLPLRVRLIWPAILVIAPTVERVIGVEYTERLRARLAHAGLSYLYMPHEFVALRIVTSAIFFIAVAVVFEFLDLRLMPWILLAIVFGYMAPAIRMSEKSRKREKEIIRTLPIYLDFITMTVEAGLSLGGALAQAVSKGPPGLFRSELERVNRDIKAGAGRIEAMQSMAERLDIREVTTLVNAIALAERTGGSVGNVLRAQADQRLTERFQRAEKLAMEAPVKLVFPLVAFIFPSTFIVIGFPIAMKFIHSGALQILHHGH
jgi:tight adherence protein C